MSERLTGITRIKDSIKKKGVAAGAAGVLLVAGCSTRTQENPDTPIVFTLKGDCSPGKKGRADLFNIPYNSDGGSDFFIRAGKDGIVAKVNVSSRSLEVEGVPPPSEQEEYAIELQSPQDERTVFELKATKEGIKTAVICE